MIPRTLGRKLAVASTALLVVAVIGPQAALADPAAPRTATIIITDKGFDKPVYTVGDGGGTHDSDKPTVTFVNQGTVVHGAKTFPGTLDQGIQFGSFTDAGGNVTACWVDSGCPTGGFAQPLDTGGIPPGGSETVGMDPLDLPTDYIFTSPTDCLFGNITPGFNCTPSKIHVSDHVQGLTPLSNAMKGSWLFPVGDSLCRTDVLPVTPDIGPAFCYGKYGIPGRALGSSKKPLNGATINITDFGYDPAQVWVLAGSTVTWVNTGERVHSVKGGGGPSRGPDNFNIFNSPGLAPGESYSYTFTTFTADDPAAPPSSFSSSVGLDLLPIRYGTDSVNSNDNAVPHCNAKHGGVECGTPLMTGAIHVIDPNAP